MLKLDAFRKIPTELTNPTVHGAWLTILAYVVMAGLFFLELRGYLATNVTKTVELDARFDEVACPSLSPFPLSPFLF